MRFYILLFAMISSFWSININIVISQPTPQPDMSLVHHTMDLIRPENHQIKKVNVIEGGTTLHSINDSDLILTAEDGEYARIGLGNALVDNQYWTISGLISSTEIARDRLNLLHYSVGNVVSLSGEGNTGLNESHPSARLHIGQGGQAVGKGLRFDDGVNSDWDITHGFGLRFHFGGQLRGFINANTGAYTQSSDRRLKTELRTLGAVLDKVTHLKVVNYRYKNSSSDERTIGFVAQELQPLFPDLVSYSESDDIYGINYGGVATLAIKAIQELQEIIEAQEKRIAELEEKLIR